MSLLETLSSLSDAPLVSFSLQIFVLSLSLGCANGNSCFATIQ